MRRADRLFAIVQLLRGGRYVTARRLAERLEVSERTIYRDVDELSLSGVPVEGEAGRGYRLPKSFEIPPLMFERHEVEALVVGVRLVEAWCGPGLAASARSALTRIRGAVPAALVERVDDARIYAPRFARGTAPSHFEIAYQAIDQHRCLVIDYAGEDGTPSTRTIRRLPRNPARRSTHSWPRSGPCPHDERVRCAGSGWTTGTRNRDETANACPAGRRERQGERDGHRKRPDDAHARSDPCRRRASPRCGAGRLWQADDLGRARRWLGRGRGYGALRAGG
jgi:biotin operon repressor